MKSQLRLLGAVLLAAGPLAGGQACPDRRRRGVGTDEVRPLRVPPRSNRPIGGPACR
ncbi:hypothetical protein [Paractinoplanes durhamensis]|uniref:Uncharacterized protein n=1 Tax=Paractinoplanes durhamensis TaxID=113563 RepID=A0ABQ3Z6N5_9ACTN|nr:hypothetical protein [Actinoplanes durhamensis]GIE05436.1 hypothetical protein Adu01nite_67860 [Actinoplanes durhamensis]